MTDADELIELLTRRHGILSTLVDDPIPRHELVDELDASKSTVYKGVGQLEAAELLESTVDVFDRHRSALRFTDDTRNSPRS